MSLSSSMAINELLNLTRQIFFIRFNSCYQGNLTCHSYIKKSLSLLYVKYNTNLFPFTQVKILSFRLLWRSIFSVIRKSHHIIKSRLDNYKIIVDVNGLNQIRLLLSTHDYNTGGIIQND